MKYESTPERLQARDRIVDLLANTRVEEVATHEAIRKAASLAGDLDPLLYSALSIAVKEHAAAFESVRGVGYKRLAPGDIHRVGLRMRHSIRGRARKGQRQIGAVIEAYQGSLTREQKLDAYAELSVLGIIEASASRGASSRARRMHEKAHDDHRAPPSHAELTAALITGLTAA